MGEAGGWGGKGEIQSLPWKPGWDVDSGGEPGSTAQPQAFIGCPPRIRFMSKDRHQAQEKTGLDQ